MRSKILNAVPKGVELRDVQKELLLEIERRWAAADVIAINAPTALGKSIISLTLGAWKGARIITPSNILVKQCGSLASMLNYTAKDMYASSKYTCKHEDKLSCAAVPKYNKGRRCEGCVYNKERAEALNSSVTISTYHMVQALGKPYLPLIADEAHNLIRFTQDQDSIRVWPHKHGVPLEYLDSIDTLKDYIATHDTANTPLDLIADDLFLKEGQHPRYVYEITQELWGGGGRIYGTDYERGEPEYAPMILGHPLDIRGKLKLGQNSNKLILMSATINRSDIIQLGLDTKKVFYIEAKSPIPVENRPLVKNYIGKMNHRNRAKMADIMADRIRQYLKDRPDKGFIHATYSLAKMLKDRLQDEPRLMFHDKTNTSKTLNKFRMSKDGVMIGSGLEEGLSLDYDDARWQIITAIPWPSLASPLYKYQAEYDPDFYLWSTLKKLIQAYGRVCRTPKDYGHTEVWDENFDRVIKDGEHLLPGWFKESIV